MGLDMYAYVAARAGQQREYYDTANWDNDSKELISPVTKPREIAYWRKHPNLHGWMEELYRAKGGNVEMFNGVELELTWEDLEVLERDLLLSNLPNTRGFFFGDNSDEYYREQDLKFIREARAEIFTGLRVFYNSSW